MSKIFSKKHDYIFQKRLKKYLKVIGVSFRDFKRLLSIFKVIQSSSEKYQDLIAHMNHNLISSIGCKNTCYIKS